MQDLFTAVRSLTFILLCLVATTASAQSSQPLSSVLNTDGSINASITGSFDVNGYRMISGPNGEPRFVPSQQPSAGGCTPDKWDTTFSSNGANNDVNAIVSDGAGNIYFGGDFTTIQGIPMNGIAKWNGSAWSALGSGILGAVNSIAINGTDIYVGGSFGAAGGNPARNVAKWDGSAWTPLGAGLGGGTHIVEAVAFYNGELFVGGNFNTNDGSAANGLVRWNGSAFSAAGVSGQVYDLQVKGGNLYVGGFVGVIADPTMAGFLKWDGVNWSGFGLLNTTTVRTIAFNGTDIWLGGVIRRTGSSDTHVAKWNGTAWTSLAFFSPTPIIHAFAFVGTDVYVGGTFERFNGILSDGIVKYNGTVWSEAGTGTQLGSAEVYAMLTLGSTVYIGGDFQLANGVAARNIATLTNGSTWAAAFPGTGLDSAAAAIAPSGTDVYLGGAFLSAGPITANRIAKWDGGNGWSALGAGISGLGTEFSSISAIAVAGGKVYAGGSFSRIGTISSANSIAVWNGTTWSALGTGITGGNARVTQIVVQGDDVIVAGDFTTAGGVAANRLAKWNGSSWSPFPGNPPIPTFVTGIGFIGSDMYVTSTSTAVENPNYVLKYDGTNWTGIAPGMGGHGITSMVVIGSDLYVSGGFQAIAGVPAIRVAKWNGTSWSALGGGLPTTSGSASVFVGTTGTDLIASGDFTPAAGGPPGFIVRWNGSGWTTLGNGLNTFATKIVSAGGDLFIGGGFTTAGCNQSPYFARWRETVWTGSASADWHNPANWGGPVPAANAGMTIAAANATISSADVSVSSLIVTNGRTLAIGAGRTLTVNGKLDLNNAFLTGPGNLIVNGDLNVTNSDVIDLGAITINGNLYLNGGKITGTAPVNLTTCRATALSGGGVTSFITSPFTRCIGTSGTYLFPVGNGTVYSPVEISNITGSGNLTVEAKAGSHAGATGLPANRLQRWWNFTNSGITQANLVFSYLDSEVVGLEHRYRIYSINGGAATQLPTTLNQTTNRAAVSGATSFSQWTLAEGTPVPLTLLGRVTNPNGRGAAGILVSLDDGQGNVRYAITSSLGYYRFANVPTFNVYTVRVSSKKYTFTNPERVVDFDEFTTSINFVSSDN